MKEDFDIYEYLHLKKDRFFLIPYHKEEHSGNYNQKVNKKKFSSDDEEEDDEEEKEKEFKLIINEKDNPFYTRNLIKT